MLPQKTSRNNGALRTGNNAIELYTHVWRLHSKILAWPGTCSYTLQSLPGDSGLLSGIDLSSYTSAQAGTLAILHVWAFELSFHEFTPAYTHRHLQVHDNQVPACSSLEWSVKCFQGVMWRICSVDSSNLHYYTKVHKIYHDISILSSCSTLELPLKWWAQLNVYWGTVQLLVFPCRSRELWSCWGGWSFADG